MKHYFVINPVAGKKDDTERISNELKELTKKEEF